MSRPIVAVVALVVLLSTLAGVAGGAPEPATSAGAGALAETGAAGQTAPAAVALQSGSEYWSGEQLTFDASEVVPSDASEADRTFELWQVTDDGQLNKRVRTFVVPGNGTYALETEDLVGRYAVRYGEQVVYVHEGVGYLRSPPDGSDVTVDSAAFAFTRQTLSFAWSDPSIFPGQQTTLTVTSNRGDYTAAVSGGNLSFSELASVFPRSAYAENYDERADEDVLLVRAGGAVSFDLDTSALEPARGDFEFDVVDAAAAETAHLTVAAPASDGRFVTLERREHVGDVIEANVSCSHCFLVVGGPDQGFIDVVELTDGDGDGHVVLDVNTRYAGMKVSSSGYPSGVEAYSSPTDGTRQYSPSDTLETLEEELTYSYTELSDLRSQQGLASTGRARPVAPGKVRLTLATSDFVIDRSAYGDREPLGSRMVIRDETDVRTVILEPRALSSAETLAAPGGPRLPDDVGTIESQSGPRDSVAVGDHLVFRFDVSGVYGYYEANGVSVETVRNNLDEGIRLTLSELPDDGAGRIDRPLKQTAAKVYADPGSDSLYLAVQTGGTSGTNLQEGRYRARLTLQGVAGADEYSTIDAYNGYPYVEPGETESVAATATVEPPRAAIASPEEGSSPHLNANESLVVTGTTSLAPDGEVRLEATATEYAWDTATTATVNETGHWTGSLNLTGAPGDEFTVTLRHGETSFDERTYTVLPPLENSSDGGGSGGESGGSGGGAGDALPSGGLLSGVAGLVVPVGGGIGALVLVWVVWRLVIRQILL